MILMSVSEQEQARSAQCKRRMMEMNEVPDMKSAVLRRNGICMNLTMLYYSAF